MLTERDKIWVATLTLIEYNRTFTAQDVLSEISANSPSIRTIRNTLDAMESAGLLVSEGGAGRSPRKFSPVTADTEIEVGGYKPRKTVSKSTIPYAGGKNHLCEWIISHLPQHDTYVEPFGGSAGVLFNKPRSKYEIYNDSDGDLVQFFKVVRDRPDELATWLINVPFSRSVYDEWIEEYYSGEREPDPIRRAGRFFTLRYMQFAGVSSGPNGFKTRARRSPARSFDNARKRIDSLARRFDQVIIEHQDYEEILANYDDSRATVVFYLDPPYMDSSHHNGKEFDHQKFFEALHDVDNDWVLSLSQLPNELSDYWCTSRKSRHKMKQERGSVEEMLICNFDPRSRELFSETL